MSVINNTGDNKKGSLWFRTTQAKVEGRIGGVLYDQDAAGLRTFKTTPADLLKNIRIRGLYSNYPAIVTFNGGIGADKLIFEVPPYGGPVNGNHIAKLNWSGTGDVFHRMDVAAAEDGWGTLQFGNGNPANFLGDIGTAEKKLKSLIINAPAGGGSARTVRILGNIHARTIALNGNTLVLGNGTGAAVFGASGRTRTYTVGGPVTTNEDGKGNLSIRDFDFTLNGAIGTPARNLNAVSIDNATATFGGDIHAKSVTVNPKAILAVNKDNLTISGTLTLNNSATQGATLALGANTLKVKGAVNFRNTVSTGSGKAHTLSLTVAGRTKSGLLDASAAGVTLRPDLAIGVRVRENAGIQNSDRFTIVKSKSTHRIDNAFNDKVLLSGDEDKTHAFRLSLNTDRTQLDMTAIRVGRTIGEDQSLDEHGENNGVAFGGDHTLTVADGKDIGSKDGVSLDTGGQSAPRGTVRFEGDSEVKGRVGGVPTEGEGAGRRFRTGNAGPIERIEIRGGADKIVTFRGGVAARTMHFAADGNAALWDGDGPAAPAFHRVNVTTGTDGRGALRLRNLNAYFLGDIGTADNRLRAVGMLRDNGVLRILGNIHANVIALNGNTLVLGNDADTKVFGEPGKTRAYAVDAPITTNMNNTGNLRVRDFNLTFRRAIGKPARNLNAVSIDNATATFGGDIHANTVAVNANASLAVNRNNLTISGNLDLAGGATLALGANMLRVTRNVSLAGGATLSLTLGGAHGSLDVAGIKVAPDAALAIRVKVPDPAAIGYGDTFDIVKSGTKLPENVRAAAAGTGDFDFEPSLRDDGKTLTLTARRTAIFAGLTKGTPFAGAGARLDGLVRDRNVSAAMKDVLRAIRAEVRKRSAARQAAAGPGRPGTAIRPGCG